MKLSAFSAFALLITFFSGCASHQPAEPDWVAGNSAKYISGQYLIGRGHAATQEEAKDRARADIAKVFQVAVVVDSEDIQSAKSDGSGATKYESQTSRQISTRTEKIISGIRIAELWQNPADSSYHVLAVLPRSQAANSLRQQIAELDEATRDFIVQSRKHDDLFMKIADASHSLELQQTREAVQKNLQVVDITGRGVEPQWNSGKLKADLDGLLKRVSIAPRVAAGSPDGLKEMVAGALAQAGFILDTGDHPKFVLQANMKLTDLGLVDNWYWMRGNLEVTLTETAGNRVRGTRLWKIKGNAQNRDDAKRRAMNKADAILKQELGGAIIEMVTAK